MITSEQWDKFFTKLSENPNVTRAAKHAHVDRCHVYRKKSEDAEFAQRFDEARRIGWNAYEDDTLDASKDSDTLRIFMLKSNKPEIYGDKKQIDLGGKITVNLIQDIDDD